MTESRSPYDELPKLMVAPNGARLTNADHPDVPVTVAELIEVTKACHAAGADGVHAHVRNDDQSHVLDVGLYRELIDELDKTLPGFYVQVTTESIGQYTAQQQRDLVYKLTPPAVSISLREIFSDDNIAANRQLYHWALEQGTAIQHILYEPQEIVALDKYVKQGIVPQPNLQLLFVLGRYTKNQVSDPDDIQAFLSVLDRTDLTVDWAVCAFGVNETRCLHRAFALGGKARVGFENNTRKSDGKIARDNAERVSEVLNSIKP